MSISGYDIQWGVREKFIRPGDEVEIPGWRLKYLYTTSTEEDLIFEVMDGTHAGMKYSLPALPPKAVRIYAQSINDVFEELSWPSPA